MNAFLISSDLESDTEKLSVLPKDVSWAETDLIRKMAQKLPGNVMLALSAACDDIITTMHLIRLDQNNFVLLQTGIFLNTILITGLSCGLTF